MRPGGYLNQSLEDPCATGGRRSHLSASAQKLEANIRELGRGGWAGCGDHVEFVELGWKAIRARKGWSP